MLLHVSIVGSLLIKYYCVHFNAQIIVKNEVKNINR